MNSIRQVEEWRTIEETNGRYEVNNFGQIRNTETGNIRKLYLLPNGYLYVSYHINGKRKHRYVHRLVADAFCNHTEGYDIINHIDNNKQNNRADNLEWTTQFNNVHHGMKQKRYRLNAIPVVGYKDGEQYPFLSAHDAQRKTGCDEKQIMVCCRDQSKRTNGYRWEFAEATI